MAECEATMGLETESVTALSEPPFDINAPFPTTDVTVYAVMGETGEYSDRTDWFVCAYMDAAAAQAHAERAQYVARRIEGDARATGRSLWANSEPNPHDPNMQIDYTGTSYTVIPMPLVAADG